MLEQEVASIIHYVLDKSGLENLYTDILPESFAFPSVYFPAPQEAETDYNTLSSYQVYYRMPVRFFDVNNQSAYQKAFAVANALIGERNRIPLIGNDGQATGEHFRVKNSKVEKKDTGVYGFNIEWVSVRTFDDIPTESE